MKITILPQGTMAIYEQIVNQLKNEIVTGELTPGEALPSIRMLAADLSVSVITTKRAYEELEKQPVQGENILSSKKEIEGSLDTLNTAFEKLLDRLFQDQAWDVSSDISVLKTMIAQDGLAEEDF